MTDSQALARLALRHACDPVHTALLRLAQLWLTLERFPGTLGLSVCSDCERIYACARWPNDGERMSISHGICDECETELYPAEVAS